MWSSRQERVAARAIMSQPTVELRIGYIQSQLQLSDERAKDLLEHAEKVTAKKKADIRQFVGLVADDGPAQTTLIMQLGVAAGLVAFGGFLLSGGRSFLGGVCMVIAAANVVIALREHARRRREAAAAKDQE